MGVRFHCTPMPVLKMLHILYSCVNLCIVFDKKTFHYGKISCKTVEIMRFSSSSSCKFLFCTFSGDTLFSSFFFGLSMCFFKYNSRRLLHRFAFFCCRTIQNTPIVKNKKSMICKPIIINSISFCHLLIHISIVISAPILSYYIKSFLTV